MNKTDIPIKMPTAWAEDAVGGGNIVYPVPVSPQPGGQASYEDGYPPINSEQIAIGGIPPWGNVTNGILRALTLWAQWAQLGGPVPWDSTFSGALAVPGYPSGAIVTSAVTPNKLWISTVDGNVTNPDAGGAGWLPWPYPFYAVDTGAVNAMAAALPLPLAAIPVGTVLRINPAFANTSSTPTLRINGGSAVTITSPLGVALATGAIAYHVPAEIMVAPGPALWLLNSQASGSPGVAAHGSQAFFAPGSYNFTIPATALNIWCWGPGGGGGGSFTGGSGAGGGGGGLDFGVFNNLTVGANIALVIPAGGTGGTPGGGDGSPAGGPTTVTGYLQATTGGGGTGAINGSPSGFSNVGGAGGVGSGGSLAMAGQAGSPGALFGGSAPQGGPGGVMASNVTGVASNGSWPGGGGSPGAGFGNNAGGNGAAGGVLFTW